MANSILSVVIPVKDLGAAERARVLELATDAPVLDFIVVGTCSVTAPEHVDNLRIIDRPCSIYEAMNIGARESASEYLLFMGIDDVLIAANAAEIVTGLQRTQNASLVVLPFRVGSRLVRQGPTAGRLSSFHHQGVLFHRRTLLELGGYATTYRLHSDLDLMFRMQRAGSVQALGLPLVVFSKGGMTTSGRHSMTSIREFSAIYRRHGVNRLTFGYLFSITLLVWYRMRFLGRQLFSGSAAGANTRAA